jgi:hypothetical protein
MAVLAAARVHSPSRPSFSTRPSAASSEAFCGSGGGGGSGGHSLQTTGAGAGGGGCGLGQERKTPTPPRTSAAAAPMPMPRRSLLPEGGGAARAAFITGRSAGRSLTVLRGAGGAVLASSEGDGTASALGGATGTESSAASCTRLGSAAADAGSADADAEAEAAAGGAAASTAAWSLRSSANPRPWRPRACDRCFPPARSLPACRTGRSWPGPWAPPRTPAACRSRTRTGRWRRRCAGP